MSFRDDVIAPLINDMMSGVGDLNLFGMSLADVLKAPSELSWGAGADSGIKAMAAATVSPVASVVLVTLAYVELNRTLALSEADGESRFRQSLATVLKILLCIVLLEWAPQVLEAILQVTADMAADANAAMQTALADKTRDGGDNISAFLDSIDKLDWIGQAVLVIILLFAWLINKAAVLIALGLIVIRFVKLMIYTGFSPIAASFMVSSDTRPWGLGFLKKYISVALQAFVMVLAFGLYQMVSLSYGINKLTLGNGSIADALVIGVYFMFMGVILGMIVAGTGRIADELMGG